MQYLKNIEYLIYNFYYRTIKTNATIKWNSYFNLSKMKYKIMICSVVKNNQFS